jgi:hypothetical protein
MTITRLVTLVLAGALLAGCGSSGSGSSGVPSLAGGSGGSPTATAKGSTESQLLAFSRCMRTHGMPDWPDPVTDADGNTRLQFPKGVNPSSAALTQARDACQSYLKGLAQGLSQSDRTAMQDALLSFTKCMRANGVDIPDPDFGKSGGMESLTKLDQNDPRVAKAMQPCRKYLQQLQLLGGK